MNKEKQEFFYAKGKTKLRLNQFCFSVVAQNLRTVKTLISYEIFVKAFSSPDLNLKILGIK